MTLRLALSILDLAPVASGSTAQQALQDTLRLARRADELGYTRFWLAEHHNMPSIASSAPEILIGQVARVTTRLRVGAGGIMLPNHAPLKVAEWFRTLEALFPNRIDLGIGRAPGTDPLTAYALRGQRASLGAQEFPNQLADLLHFGDDSFPEDHPLAPVRAMPAGVPLPPVWLLGSSGYSAQLAARLGLGFGFAAHFSDLDPALVIRSYRQNFQPSQYLAAPHSILTLSVVCAETDAEAAYLGKTQELLSVMLAKNQLGPLPSPEEALAYPYTAAERAIVEGRRQQQITGSPTTVKRRIADLVAVTGADEVMISSLIHDPAKRLRSFELLAQAFEL